MIEHRIVRYQGYRMHFDKLDDKKYNVEVLKNNQVLFEALNVKDFTNAFELARGFIYATRGIQHVYVPNKNPN